MPGIGCGVARRRAGAQGLAAMRSSSHTSTADGCRFFRLGCSNPARDPVRAKTSSTRNARNRQRWPDWQHASVSDSPASHESQSRRWPGTLWVFRPQTPPQQRRAPARCLDPCFQFRRHQWPRAPCLRRSSQACAKTGLSARALCNQPSRRLE